MCGITGYAGNDRDLNREVLDSMNAAILRRGPDEDGRLVEPGIGLAMRRLSILDLAGSRQPIENEDRSVAVVFNGEIYNYQFLRRELMDRGHRFRTSGDTEVLVHLYEEYGEDMALHLRGMFAFALWDRTKKRLLIVRDRIGIKPLYYSVVGESLLFGSEIKSILRSERVETALDPQALDAFLTLTYIPAPMTIYKSIRKLPPGHLLVWEGGRVEIREYWDLDMDACARNFDPRAIRERTEEALKDAVQSHLVSDVPVGAFLSGGVDSSLVVGMMSEALDTPVSTFTMGFSGERTGIRDERELAKIVGARYGTKFHDFEVEPRLTDILDDVVAAFDEPFADDSVVPSYYVCKLTSEHVKVALSGLGGDELFGGYHRYRGLHASRYYDWMPRWMRGRVLDPLLQRIPEPAGGSDKVDHIKRFSRASTLGPDRRYLEYVSSLGESQRRALYTPALAASLDFEATAEVITGPFNRYPTRDLVDRALYTDLKTYLPGDILALSDRLSMWHSLELRVPLIDHQLAELAMGVPSRFKVGPRGTKLLLKEVANAWVPNEILTSRKQGFESPMGAWIRNDLKGFAEDALLGESWDALGLFDSGVVRRLFEDHCAGRRKNSKILFSLIMFSAWYRHSRASVAL